MLHALLLGLCLIAWPALATGQTSDASATDGEMPRSPREEAAKEDVHSATEEGGGITFGVPLTRTSRLPVTINGVARGGAQWVADPPRARDDVFGFGALDVVVVARLSENAVLMFDVEALAGPGPDQALGTLARLNADAERLEGRDTHVFLREAFLRLQTIDTAVRFNIGKLDVAHYVDRNAFAEDETHQFLAKAFTTNPMLKEPPNSPGAVFRMQPGAWRYVVGVHAPDDLDGEMAGLPFIVGEVAHRDLFPLAGHYRWWARVTSVADRRDDVTWGTGVSIDQLVGRDTGIFVRAALSRSEGESLTSHAWSTGVQHSPRWLGRAQDSVALAYSVVREAAGRERLVEAYYNLSVAECCALIANVQWLVSGPNEVTGGRNRDVVVAGLRGLLRF